MTDVAFKALFAAQSKVPNDVKDRVEASKRRVSELSSENNECIEFWRGNQYIWRTPGGYVTRQGTLINELGKPRHRIRQVRNIIVDVIRGEVSASTQRVPDYQILPSTADQEDVSAARIATKVARFGYDKWHVRSVTEQVVTYSLITKTGEGFAWPYWDTSVGPIIDPENNVGVGEVKIGVYGPNEVGWEPGVKFDDSRYYIVRQAKPLHEIEALPGFLGFKVVPDAQADAEASQKGGKHKSSEAELVMVTEYLERPCQKYPGGRRLVIVNNKLAIPPEDYPFTGADGQVVDEPVLHKLSYIVDPESDRDIGLVPHLLDAQRTYNDCNNKQLEWKNMALNPQILAPMGAFSKRQRLTDEPGAVFTYTPVAGLKPEWRSTPPIPQELEQIKNDALADVRRIAAQNVYPQDSSGKALQVLIEKDASARQAYVARLAEFHSRLMRHCLTLVARYYTEPRMLKINGMFGPDNIADFKGSDLHSQVDVLVLPESIEPRTKQSLEQRIMAYAQLGWISGEKAMDAIEKGTAADIVDSYQLDVSRAHRLLRSIMAGPEAFLSQPLVPGPDGMPTAPWMPRKQDAVPVHRTIFADFSKTVEYEQSAPPVQEAINLYLEALDMIEEIKQQQLAMQQANMAESLGASNAAKPASTPPLPSQAADAFRPQGGQ